MESLFDGLVAHVEELPPIAVYLVIAAISYVEYLLPPVPGDAVVVVAGYMAGLQIIDPVLVVVLSTAAGTVGFMTVYWLGMRWQGVSLRKRVGVFSSEDVARAVAWLQRWGYGLIAANRLFSGIRSVIAIAAGMVGMRRGLTAGLACAAALTWAILLTVAGYLVGDQWEIVSDYLSKYGIAMSGVLIVFVVVQIWRRMRLQKS